MPILLHTSPFRAMRSEPTKTASILPSPMTLAAMPSVMTRTSMPAFMSSQEVMRAPCRSGRVSSAKTATRLPWACAV